MSVFDGRRLPVDAFGLDVERLRRGWYTDKYFSNVAHILARAARDGYRFRGEAPQRIARRLDTTDVDVGNMRVEMQWFPRRRPFCVLAGVDEALAILKECTGYFGEGGHFVNTYDQTQVWAAQDGDVVPYDGDPMNVSPVLKVRGRYRDFAILETPTVGALTRGSRIATNVYQVLKAARGKPVLFFPARFDSHEVQPGDGYAYHIAVQLLNRETSADLGSFVSTDAQGQWWGGSGGGTIPHAAIACYLGDVAEAMMAFAEYMPPEVPRIALVDFENDCLGDSLKTMKRMFLEWAQAKEENDEERACRYRLFGVRPDTDSTLRDVSVPPSDDPEADCGVNPRLIRALRRAVDEAYRGWDIPERWLPWARQWCREVKIVATGGLNPERIEAFERQGVPVDIYGVGSWLLSSCSHCGTSNDFTADVVRVEINGKWHDLAKVGRRPCDNPQLLPVDVSHEPPDTRD
ncbi:MAG: nicotinate phosphoribosyltransferase [Armatimonadota bacterium]